MLGAAVDSWLTHFSARFSATSADSREPGALVFQQIQTPVSKVRLFDSNPSDLSKPCVVFVPDGPNIIEHHAALFALLTPRFRVVCFDMPGFGYSLPQTNYTHSLDQGAAAVLGVLDALNIPRACLAFSCANGFFALRAARLAPQRIAGLILTQTPALAAMTPWTKRVVFWPLRLPIVGQIFGWLTRQQLAHGWYRLALPRNTNATQFQATAQVALHAGSCFCLSGLVQGLGREDGKNISGINVPCTMVWGEMDHSHKYTDPVSLLTVVPHAEIIRFADCGHFSDLEQPQRYAELLTERVMRYNSTTATA